MIQSLYNRLVRRGHPDLAGKLWIFADDALSDETIEEVEKIEDFGKPPEDDDEEPEVQEMPVHSQWVSASTSYLRLGEDVFALFTLRHIPSIVILGHGGNLAQSEKFDVYVIKARGMQQQARKGFSQLAYLPSFYSMSKAYLMDNFLHNPDYKKFIERKKVMDRSVLFQFLTTDRKMPKSVWHKYFGAEPELSEDATVKVGNATLLFTSNVSEKKKAQLLDVAVTSYNLLKKAGFGKLFRDHVRFTNTGSRTVGYYNIRDKDIYVDDKARKDTSTIHTIVHEYGHKFYFEDMKDKKAVQEKYREVRPGSKSRIEDRLKDFDNELKEKIKLRMEFDYVGRSKKVMKGTWLVREVSDTHDGPVVTLINKKVPEIKVRVHVRNLINEKRWKGQGSDIRRMAKSLDDIIGKDDAYEGWFPSDYSRKNAEEFWAELFAFYVRGKLSGEQRDWIQAVL